MAVALPPVEPADQLLGTEAELGHLQGALGGAVTADAVAVGDDQGGPVDGRGAFTAHLAVRDVDRAGDVLAREGLARPRVDRGDSLARLARDLEVPGVDLELELVAVVLELPVHGA